MIGLVIFIILIGVAVAYFNSKAMRRPVGDMQNRLASIEKNTADPVKLVQGEKICPKCAEAVKAAALICRFCGYEFDPSTIPPARTVVVTNWGDKSRVQCAFVELIARSTKEETEFSEMINRLKPLELRPLFWGNPAVMENLEPEDAALFAKMLRQCGAKALAV